MACKNVFFDLDGTLIDSSPGIVNAMRHAISVCGVPAMSDSAIRACIGQPLLAMMRKACPDGDEDFIKRMGETYREYFSRKGVLEASIYDGVVEMLNSLLAKGAALYIVSSKPLPFCEKVTQALSLRSFFKGISAPSLDFKPKKKAELMADLMAAEKLAPEDCIMVGDRAEDMEAAKANRVPTIGVAYGFGSREELEQAGAVGIAGKAAEISTMAKL